MVTHLTNYSAIKENQARKALDGIFDTLLADQKGGIPVLPIETIEIQVRKQLDLNDLGISNYYRLRRYFIDKYKKNIPRKKKAV